MPNPSCLHLLLTLTIRVIRTTKEMDLIAAAAAKHSFWHVLRQLGGPGLILLGLVDNSFVPVPGSMDALTLVLASSHQELWWYYALMATVGSLIGGYLTYRLGVKGGEETLEKRVSKKHAGRIRRIFARYGFWSVAVGAISPPPIPIVPFLMAAGAMKYSRKKFLAALTLGRSVRYSLVAYLGSIYGSRILRSLGYYYRPLVYTLIAIGVVGGLLALSHGRRHRGAPSEDRTKALSRHAQRT